jgi:hypothetical protein
MPTLLRRRLLSGGHSHNAMFPAKKIRLTTALTSALFFTTAAANAAAAETAPASPPAPTPTFARSPTPETGSIVDYTRLYTRVGGFLTSPIKGKSDATVTTPDKPTEAQKIFGFGPGDFLAGGIETRGGWFGSALDINIAYSEQSARPALDVFGTDRNKFTLQEVNAYLGAKVKFYPWDFLNFSLNLGLGWSSQNIDFGGEIKWKTGTGTKVVNYATDRTHYNGFSANFGGEISYFPTKWLAIDVGATVRYTESHEIGPLTFKLRGCPNYHIAVRFLF